VKKGYINLDAAVKEGYIHWDAKDRSFQEWLDMDKPPADRLFLPMQRNLNWQIEKKAWRAQIEIAEQATRARHILTRLKTKYIREFA
jgi:hypothetical protein